MAKKRRRKSVREEEPCEDWDGWSSQGQQVVDTEAARFNESSSRDMVPQFMQIMNDKDEKREELEEDKPEAEESYDLSDRWRMENEEEETEPYEIIIEGTVETEEGEMKISFSKCFGHDDFVQAPRIGEDLLVYEDEEAIWATISEIQHHFEDPACSILATLQTNGDVDEQGTAILDRDEISCFLDFGWEFNHPGEDYIDEEWVNSILRGVDPDDRSRWANVT
jgi:hypothetical protein